jgi:phasin family protein
MATSTNSSTDSKTGGFAGIKMPKVDTNALLDSYKKNLEILGLVNKMSLEVCNGVAKLQSAFFKQFLSDLGGVAEKAAKPSDAIAKFSEVVRDNVVRAIGNNKQISDMVTTNGNALTAAIAKRFKESLEEAKTVVNKKQA